MPADRTAYTAEQLALIEAGIARGENMIFIGYGPDEMACYYVVSADW